MFDAEQSFEKFCSKNNLIAMEQIGFKAKSRTSDPILTKN